MSAKAAPGWGSAHLAAIRPGKVALDPAEQLAVHQTLARYAFALDQRDLEALGAVLTDDATWAFKIAGESDLGPVVGRAAILAFVRDAMDAETDQRRHNLVNVVFHSADADTALVHAYLMLTSNAGGGGGVVATGFYAFGLERTGGEWRIAELFLGTDNAW
ncbi:nuclear transport factor 2 family protein [Streptomyces sp. NEAU-YJ-81]|uniref:nuclear transport factor 2 family protein n=1 Tax=Streptomyces sp. NEAU-YJ-81 TaxID=2820288 RepID=UPI001ABD391B|nr:nuclear transport factor 2 family protein [Streptomyces sp. NEAU-YJ-81]MBO3675478.1 nuclear transport factor 2 family protein [Streptomyces sp. NEAU-YJ-81]